MIDERLLIKELEWIEKGQMLHYMSCGCTVEQYNNEIGWLFNKIYRIIHELENWINVTVGVPSDERFKVLVTDGKNIKLGIYRINKKQWETFDLDQEQKPCKIGEIIAWLPVMKLCKKENEDELLSNKHI